MVPVRLQKFLNHVLQDRERTFRFSVGLSILLHSLLWLAFWSGGLHFDLKLHREVEVDLTRSFKIGGNPLLKPGGGTLDHKPKIEGPPLKTENKPSEKPVKPKDWVLPGPQTKEIEKPVEPTGPVGNAVGGTPEGTGEGYEGTGGGVGGGDGEGGGIPLQKLPSLLNRKEVLRLLRKNYPPNARELGIQGYVVVTLHLDKSGVVTDCKIEQSSNPEFEPVAKMVAYKMKFSPALVTSGPVAAKIRQTVMFQLEDE